MISSIYQFRYFNFNNIFWCICRWCSHFLDNLKEKSPKLEIKKKFYFHLISTFTQSCQKSEFYWEAGTQQNPNIKSARFCIVFISSRILHYSVCNIDFQSEWSSFKTCWVDLISIWMKLTFRCLGDILTWEIGLGRHWGWWGHNFEQNTEMQHRTVASENRKLATRRGGEEGVYRFSQICSILDPIH